MVSHGRVELLAHPLSQKYLEMKWNSYGKYFHVATLLLYGIYLTFITMFSSSLMATPYTFNHTSSVPKNHTFNTSSIETDNHNTHKDILGKPVNMIT